MKKQLPLHVQEIYLAAFNNAWHEYQDAENRRNNASQEDVAHKIDWAAVKHQYKKVGDEWCRK